MPGGQDRVVLTVDDAPEPDVGLGRARVDTKTRLALGVDFGEIILLVGNKSTAAPVFRVMQEDEGKGIIRIDGLVRRNVAVNLGDKIDVRKAEVLPAERITIEPIINKGRKISFGQGIENFVKQRLLKRPLNEGDAVIVPGVALMGRALEFTVIGTAPKGIVEIQDDTIIEIRDVNLTLDGILVRLISLLEDIEAALGSLKDADRENALALRAGMLEQLRRAGVEVILVSAGDPFDASIHEAVGEAPDPRFELGRVKETIRDGMRSSNRVIRRTLVILVGRETVQYEQDPLEQLRREVRRLRGEVE